MKEVDEAKAGLSANIMGLTATIEADYEEIVSSLCYEKDDSGRLEDISIECRSKAPEVNGSLASRVFNLYKLFVSTQVLYMIKDFETAYGVQFDGFQAKSDEKGRMIGLEVNFTHLPMPTSFRNHSTA